MKKVTLIALTLALGASLALPAQADWGRRGDYRPPVSPGHAHHHHWRGSDWIGPAAVLALTGAVIGAATYNAYSPPPAQPVIVEPPRPVVQSLPPGSWYFCRSSGQYYPYTRYCPEGWQPVMPGNY